MSFIVAVYYVIACWYKINVTLINMKIIILVQPNKEITGMNPAVTQS